MKPEEAIAFFKDMNECTYGNLEAVEMAIKALEKEPVLDKIRAEIIELPTISFNANDVYKAEVLQIIDKYRESEDR